MGAPTPANWATRAIDSAADLTKQILTLSTGVLTLTLTFYNNFFGKAQGASLAAPSFAKWCLGVSWVALVFSILAGLLVLAKITGNQGEAGDKNTVTTVNEPSLRGFSIAQWITFGAGMIAVGLAGVVALAQS